MLEDGLTIHGKSLREHFEAVNYQEAIELVERWAKPSYTLCAGNLLEVHGLVLQTVERDFAGRYRNAGVWISSYFASTRAIPGYLSEQPQQHLRGLPPYFRNCGRSCHSLRTGIGQPVSTTGQDGCL